MKPRWFTSFIAQILAPLPRIYRKHIMITDLRFRLSLIIACFLFCGSAILAQQPGHPDGQLEADQHGDAHAQHGDAHAADGHEFAMAHVDHRPRESYLGWMIRCMGIVGLLIPVAGLFCFALTLIVVIRGQGPFAFAALALLVPIPFLLGLLGTLQGMILSLQVIAVSSIAPKPSEVSDGITTALFNPLLGLIFMTPSYLVATVGSVVRAFAKSAANPPIKS